MTILETERLRLRRFRPEDAAVLARWEADANFKRHLGDPTPAGVLLARMERHWQEHGFGLLAVEWRETGELVGRTGPQFHRAWAEDPEVGWALDPAWWGRGIATEAGGAAVGWAFGELGFGRVVSITTEANVASRRVMAKLGFRVLTRFDWERWELWIHALDRAS